MELEQFSRDFADALQSVDASGLAHKTFQPGIGPYGERAAIAEAAAALRKKSPAYETAGPKKLIDLFIPGQWMFEMKIARPFGDNGKQAEHWSENLLYPYPGNVSALADCLKLQQSGLPERKAVVIMGYEHTPPQIPLEPAMRSFELIAREVLGIRLSDRLEQVRAGLRHPTHQVLRLYSYEVHSFGSTAARVDG